MSMFYLGIFIIFILHLYLLLKYIYLKYLKYIYLLFFLVKSEQVSSRANLYQEQNVTDSITSSYGVGPTDDNGRPLFGLRALRKTNANQSDVSGEYNIMQTSLYTYAFHRAIFYLHFYIVHC